MKTVHWRLHCLQQLSNYYRNDVSRRHWCKYTLIYALKHWHKCLECLKPKLIFSLQLSQLCRSFQLKLDFKRLLLQLLNFISSSPAEGFNDLLKETSSESTHKTTAKCLRKVWATNLHLEDKAIKILGFKVLKDISL